MTRPPPTAVDRRVRDALAAVILEAFERPAGEGLLRDLRAVLEPDAGTGERPFDETLARLGDAGIHGDVDAATAERLAWRLRIAEAARRDHEARPSRLPAPLAVAAALFAHGLFFEVHEVLEHAWQSETGRRRVFQQGLIQLAVGFHHLVHDKPDSATRLFVTARAKLAAETPTFDRVDLTRLLRELEPWEARARSGAGWSETLVLPSLAVG